MSAYLFNDITSPGSGGIWHTPGASRCWRLEMTQTTWGHVASREVVWEDIRGLRYMLRPSAAVPCPPVGFPGGLGGQMLGDIFCRVRGGWTRGCRKIKVERFTLGAAFKMPTWTSGRNCCMMDSPWDELLEKCTRDKIVMIAKQDKKK